MPGRWIGLTESNRALKRLPEFVKTDVQPEFEVTAFHIARRAQQTVRRKTGFLQQRIDWDARPRSFSAVVGVYSAAFYWKFLEYGTVKMGPYPFIRPAAESVRSDHHSRVLQALEKALTRMERAAR